MRGYGCFALRANIKMMQKNNEVKALWKEMNTLAKEKEIKDNYEFIEAYNELDDADSVDELSEEAAAITAFIQKVKEVFSVYIYPVYVPSDAEGDVEAGEVFWAVEIELSEHVDAVSVGFSSWCEFE